MIKTFYLFEYKFFRFIPGFTICEKTLYFILVMILFQNYSSWMFIDFASIINILNAPYSYDVAEPVAS